MSARTFDIGQSKKFGNVKVRNTPDAIIVTLHQTDIVVFDKIKNSVRITSGGWKTPTTKTAINNALSQIEAMTGLSLGRVSAVKGEWFVEQMPFRDGMIYKIKRSKKNNPDKKPKFSESDYYRNSKSKKIRSLSECVEKSMSSRSGGEVDADFIVDVNGQDWQCYTVAIGNREFTLYCYEGTATYVVDSYGSRNTCELIDWEEDEKEAVSRKNPRRRNNPDSKKEAQALYNLISNDFSKEKYLSWNVFDYNDRPMDVDDFVKSLKTGEDISDDLSMDVSDNAFEMTSYWIKENAQEDFEKLEELDPTLAAELQDEIRFKYEENANYNFSYPKPLFITDPDSLIGYKKGSRYYAEDNYLAGPYNADDNSKELKLVIKFGKIYGFNEAECKEVYMNSQGGTLGIAIITDQVKELADAVHREMPLEIFGDAVLYIHDGMNGSGHYVIKGQHGIKVKNAKDLISMIDYGSYSLGDVFGTTDWKY